MKQILCFGDSNTWGFNPENHCGEHARHPFGVRWPGRLQQLLGESCRIAEEGLNGRTTMFDSPMSPGRNGLAYADVLFYTHAPLDVVIIMLGTNDLKDFLNTTNADIAQGVRKLCERALAIGEEYCAVPKLLVVSPIRVLPGITGTWLGNQFSLRSAERSLTLVDDIRAALRDLPVTILDGKEIADPSPLDCLHMDAEGHAKFAAALAPQIQKLID